MSYMEGKYPYIPIQWDWKFTWNVSNVKDGGLVRENRIQKSSTKIVVYLVNYDEIYPPWN